MIDELVVPSPKSQLYSVGPPVELLVNWTDKPETDIEKAASGRRATVTLASKVAELPASLLATRVTG